MANEIERKFLVTNDSWREQVFRQSKMCQGYLNDNQQSSVRVRVAGDQAYLNIKSATLGVFRKEYEYAIPADDAHEMLSEMAQKPLIEKTRYYVKYADHVWEVDVFEGDNAGLIVAEVELSREDEAFERPPWAGEEVSSDPRYYNVCLVKHPYKSWTI
ncbi:MAG: CYTH domain-containing protein [Gammaproteobacteria bacterium]|jgi:adenylate cyclase|nr:CYTH domain-containing protein [Gammaproteobacteria bacterium]